MMMKKFLHEYLWFINGLFLGIATILIGLALFSNWVSAATYNVLFNNVEQGSNSTASPRVDVSNGKATKSAGPEADATAATPEVNVPVGNPAAGPIAPNAGTSVAAAPILNPNSDSFRPVRLGFLANHLGGEDFRHNEKFGGTFSLGLFPLRDFGINAFVGDTAAAPHAFYGAEVEFIPVRAGIFGWKDALELQMMVGASTLGRDMGTRGERGSIHGGLGATVNFGDRYGVTAEMRTNLSNRSDYKYWLADAGLVVRF